MGYHKMVENTFEKLLRPKSLSLFDSFNIFLYEIFQYLIKNGKIENIFEDKQKFYRTVVLNIKSTGSH